MHFTGLFLTATCRLGLWLHTKKEVIKATYLGLLEGIQGHTSVSLTSFRDRFQSISIHLHIPQTILPIIDYCHWISLRCCEATNWKLLSLKEVGLRYSTWPKTNQMPMIKSVVSWPPILRKLACLAKTTSGCEVRRNELLTSASCFQQRDWHTLAILIPTYTPGLSIAFEAQDLILLSCVLCSNQHHAWHIMV